MRIHNPDNPQISYYVSLHKEIDYHCTVYILELSNDR